MNKLRTARILMGATIIVIIAFQAYWISKLYQEEQANFKKNTDLVFRETLYRLQAERFTGDSLVFKGVPGDNIFMKDVVSNFEQIKKDSTSQANVRIHMSTGSDRPGSIIVKKDTSFIYVDARHQVKPAERIENFLENTPTLNAPIPEKRIDSMYKILLKKEGINVSYGIIKVNPVVNKDTGQKKFVYRINDNEPTKIFVTKTVPVGFMRPTFYRAEFDNPTMYLLKKMSLQIVLSFLLIALTTLSFIFIYRSLVAQKRLTAIKNEFIGNITHELKTPISTVSVAIEAMKNFNALQNPERTQEYLGIAGQELNRLSLLVDKVLRLSMFETQQVELKYEWFDAKDLVKEVLNSMQLQFEKSGATVQLELAGEDFSMMADQMHITSVIYNLLDNALKYSKDKPQINVRLEAIENSITLKVKDNGIGIAAAYKDKVFDKFFRVPNGDKHNVKGYGLGLSYVAHIVTQHKGTVTVESEEGKSTTFIIKLPKENAGS